jgi:phytoene synthase
VTSPGLAAESAEVIRAGSQSFAAASRLLPGRIRARAHMLYTWCRWCDDVMDGQVLGGESEVLTVADRRARLEALRADTEAALLGETPPAALPFRALRLAAAGSGTGAAVIAPRWPREHLEGFAMDVEPRLYPDLESLLVYCWRVAGVVGVMMALAMDVDAEDQATLRRAQDLGLAFQLTNIARDVAEDARNGRVYLPVDWLREAGVAPQPSAVLDPAAAQAVAVVARRLALAAEPYYRSAAAGLGGLSFPCAWAIAAARNVYRQIGRDVTRLGPRALAARVSTSGARKGVLAVTALAPALASRLPLPTPPRPPLWTAL